MTGVRAVDMRAVIVTANPREGGLPGRMLWQNDSQAHQRLEKRSWVNLRQADRSSGLVGGGVACAQPLRFRRTRSDARDSKALWVGSHSQAEG